MLDDLIVIRGGGDLGSGTALRLWRSGFRVVVLECSRPVAVRRSVSLAEAVFADQIQVEEMQGKLCKNAPEVWSALRVGFVPVLIDSAAESLSWLEPSSMIDAIMAKRNTGTHRLMAPFVVALGPGFEAGRDVHAVIETNRGPHLGRVIWQGSAQHNTGTPGDVAGHTNERVLRAPTSGVLHTVRTIGDIVNEGDVVATVGDDMVEAGFRGLLRGLVRDGLQVRQGMKIGDLDPRLDPRLCILVSDKSLAIAGGVLEAVLMNRKERTG